MSYRHEALFYEGTDELLAGVVPFVRQAVAAAEPVLVVLREAPLGAVADALGGDADGVLLADMDEVGANPARIIPAWRRFLDEHGHGRPLRGIGEPIWAGRSAAELIECERHEALLNVAFEGHDFWLRCPYDVGALPPAVVEEARRNHPQLTDGATSTASPSYPGTEELAAPFAAPLADPPADAATLVVDDPDLRALRELVERRAAAAGLCPERAADLILAVHELATNSLRHGGGRGRVAIWREDGAVVCEVRDRGRIAAPLAGRVEPAGLLEGGRGLWMTNQLCDLVQIRTFADGAAVRVHQRLE